MGRSVVIKKDSEEYYRVFDELHKDIVKDDTERLTCLSRAGDMTKRIRLLTDQTSKTFSSLRPVPDQRPYDSVLEELTGISSEPFSGDLLPSSGKTGQGSSSALFKTDPADTSGIGSDDLIERASLIGAILGRGIRRYEYDYIEENWRSVFRDPKRFLDSGHIASMIEEELSELKSPDTGVAPEEE